MPDYKIPLHELEALSEGHPYRSRHNHFVRIPWEWMRAANLLGGSAFAVGALLWYRSKLTGEPVTVLSNVLAGEAGLSRKAKTGGLKALVAGGLVKSVGGPGKSPRVAILPAPKSQREPLVAGMNGTGVGELLSHLPTARTQLYHTLVIS